MEPQCAPAGRQHNWCWSTLLWLAVATCGSDVPSHEPNCADAPTVGIQSAFPGDLYLNGRYSGQSTPATISRWSGLRTVAVGSAANGYLRAEIDPKDQCTIQLSEPNRVSARTWRTRLLLLRSVFADLPDQTRCAATLDQQNADRTAQSFLRSIDRHFVPFSQRTMTWTVDRHDIDDPIEIRNLGWGFALEPSDLAPYLTDVTPGDLDLIVIFYRSAGAGCVIPGPFFAFALEPSLESREAGFVLAKLEEPGDLDPVWSYFEENDPGVWIHEWLHTVADHFYPDLGALAPPRDPDGTVVHAAEENGYAAPWMTWYADLIAGRVATANGYRGITPDWLLRCTLKDRVLLPECAD